MRARTLKNRNFSRGMSLVELMCVMVILSVVMLAVMSLYIPAQRATVTQTQVSDVQSNLRLALRVMTRDLLTAGFLMTTDPIAFNDATPDEYGDVIDNRGTDNASEFLIRTRIVGDQFARIEEATYNAAIVLEISESDMIEVDGVNRFPVGSRIRIFDSVGATEFDPGDGSTVVQKAYRVEASDSGAKTITIDPTHMAGGTKSTMASSFANMQAVAVRVKDENQPPLQTIKYKLANGTLERYVNGDATDTVNKQILARNLDTVDPTAGSSRFDYFEDSDGNINRVDIKLVGKTAAGKAGTLSEEKVREIQTSVKIRNVQ